MLTIPTTNQHAGRLAAVELAVLHTAQAPCRAGVAEAVLRYLARPEVRASAHWGCDPVTTVAGVAETDTAWGAPNANANGIHIEQAAYAEFGRPGQPAWTDPEPRRMIVEQVVPLLAGICRRHKLPAVLLEPADILARRRGITDHVRISRAFGTGDHWDCGENYPLAEVVALVADQLADTPTPTTPGDTDVVRIIRTATNGDLFWWDGQTRAAITPVTPGRTWEQLEAALKRLIASHPNCETWPPATVGGARGLWADMAPEDLELIPVVS